jgi:hypothetical protein
MASKSGSKLHASVKSIEDLVAKNSDGMPCVRAEAYFHENDDDASTGCNLADHPGMQAFRDVVTNVRAQPGVSAVFVSITEVMDADEGEWPISDAILVCSNATPEQLASWFEPLTPDDIYEADSGDHVGLPAAAPGHAWLSVWWD